ncbi:zinc finger HIT domain-containing protein 3-like [Littorina saxatilis]|uniref:HIT-type domain-containing protein n=1 Tax=Littorina saxatilis TaxID=31220 RepID=A0AAN9FWR9_9CAEN
MAACTECKEAVAKYKCPKCYARYCSVGCCKLHKAKDCGSHTKSEDNGDSTNKSDVASKALRWECPREDEDYVPPEQLARLGDSEEVKAMLHNPHLRAILENLVNTDDPAKDMEAVMQEPLFVELADHCLKAVEGEEQHKD